MAILPAYKYTVARAARWVTPSFSQHTAPARAFLLVLLLLASPAWASFEHYDKVTKGVGDTSYANVYVVYARSADSSVVDTDTTDSLGNYDVTLPDGCDTYNITYDPADAAPTTQTNVGICGPTDTAPLTGVAAFTAIAGTTTANAARNLVGTSTFFRRDLQAGDLVYLSTNSAIWAQVVSVYDDTHAMLSRPLGNGTSQTVYVMPSPLAIGVDYYSHCGIGAEMTTNANGSTTLAVCTSSETCGSASICTPSYTVHVGDVVSLDSAPTVQARVTAVDDSGDTITTDVALGNGTAHQGIRVRRVGFSVTGFGDWLAGMNYGHVLPFSPSDAGNDTNYADFAFMGSKPRIFGRSLRIVETGDPADITIGRIGNGPYPDLETTLESAVGSGVRLGDIGWVGWRGNDLSGVRAIVRARTTESWTSGNGLRLEFLTTPNTTTVPLRRLMIEQDGALTIACSATDGGTCESTSLELRLGEVDTNGQNYMGMRASNSMSGNYSIVWPATVATTGNCLTVSGVSGGVVTLAWATCNP